MVVINRHICNYARAASVSEYISREYKGADTEDIKAISIAVYSLKYHAVKIYRLGKRNDSFHKPLCLGSNSSDHIKHILRTKHCYAKPYKVKDDKILVKHQVFDQFRAGYENSMPMVKTTGPHSISMVH